MSERGSRDEAGEGAERPNTVGEWADGSGLAGAGACKKHGLMSRQITHTGSPNRGPKDDKEGREIPLESVAERAREAKHKETGERDDADSEKGSRGRENRGRDVCRVYGI